MTNKKSHRSSSLDPNSVVSMKDLLSLDMFADDKHKIVLTPNDPGAYNISQSIVT